MMKFVSVVQHTSADYLGLMEDHLEGRGIRFKYFRPFTEGTPLPQPYEVGDALFLLGGGPWGTAGARDLPTLKEETALVYACMNLGKPIVGIELGAQLLALGAGGGSKPRALRLDVGYAERTDENALNGFLPARVPFASYMRDVPVPPDYAQILARDWQGDPALFQIGENNFGFTFHPGFKVAIAEDLIMEFEENPGTPGPALEMLRSKKTEIEDALVPIMTGLIQRMGLMEA
jgi:GMP synthase-like glutamine amidotransferase